MTIFIFGNPDISLDSMPLRLLPRLRELFPAVNFEIKDPNEDWEVPEELVIIDTALGIREVTVFDDLFKFKPAPRITLHDFDALANLRYLQKLGRLRKLKIIALPPDIAEDKALVEIADFI